MQETLPRAVSFLSLYQKYAGKAASFQSIRNELPVAGFQKRLYIEIIYRMRWHINIPYLKPGVVIYIMKGKRKAWSMNKGAGNQCL